MVRIHQGAFQSGADRLCRHLLARGPHVTVQACDGRRKQWLLPYPRESAPLEAICDIVVTVYKSFQGGAPLAVAIGRLLLVLLLTVKALDLASFDPQRGPGGELPGSARLPFAGRQPVFGLRWRQKKLALSRWRPWSWRSECLACPASAKKKGQGCVLQKPRPLREGRPRRLPLPGG